MLDESREKKTPRIVSRREILVGGGAIGANLVLEPYSGALAEPATSRASDSRTEEHFPTFDDREHDIEDFIQRVRESPVLKNGSPDEVFDLLTRQPSIPPTDRLTSGSRRRFYPVFSDPSQDLDDPSSYTIAEEMPLPSIAVHFSAGDGVVRANATRLGKSKILLPARVAKRLGDEQATRALEAGIDAWPVEQTLTEYKRAPILALSNKTNADLHATRAAIVGLIYDEDQKKSYPHYDAGILYDLAQVPPLRSLAERAVISDPKGMTPDVERGIVARSLLFLSSTSDRYEIEDFDKYAIGAQVFATFDSTPGAKTFNFTGILSRSVVLQARPDGPRIRGYLITGPDSIREVETKRFSRPE